MTALRAALEEYLAVHRSLGFELRHVAYYLSDFIGLAEAEGTSHITTELALRWAKRAVNAQPANWA